MYILSSYNNFSVPDRQLEKVLINCHNEFKNDTDYPVLKFEESFYGKYNVDGIEELNITPEKPKYMGQNPVKNDKIRQGTRVREAPKRFNEDYVYFDITKRISKEWR